MTVKISLVKDNKIEKEEEIQVGTYTLGREGDLDIIKNESGISREHGKLLIFEEFLLYKDLESTNGSWVEGQDALTNKWNIAAFPTFLQLANVVIGFKQDVNYVSDDVCGTLAVFENDIFINDFPLNKLGKSLVIGGVGGQLNLVSKHKSSKPALVVESRQDEVIVYSISKEFPICINGNEITGKVLLKSQDEITVDNYTILVLFFKENAYKDADSDVPIESEDERLRKAKNAEQIIKSLKSWEEGDFDATDVFKKKLAGRADVFQKIDPLMPSDLAKGNDNVNYRLWESNLFWIALIVGLFLSLVLLAIFLF